MKMKLLFLVLLMTNCIFAQVGIGTTTPSASLDIRSSNQATPANNDGVLIPKIDVFPATNPTVAQQGMLVYLTTTSGTNLPGFYYWNQPTTSWIGFTTAANSDSDWFKVGTTTAPTLITDDMFHTGNVAIGKSTTSFPLEIQSTAFDRGINNTFTSNTTNTVNKIGANNALNGSTNDETFGTYNSLTGTGTGAHNGIYNFLTGAGSGTHYGSYNYMAGIGSGSQIGSRNTIFNTQNGNHIGTLNSLNETTGSGIHYGTSNDLGGGGTGDQYGVINTISNTGNAIHYGISNNLTSNGSGNHFGMISNLSGTGAGIQYGVNNTITNAGNNAHYGVFSSLTGAGTGLHFGSYHSLGGAGNGTQYGNYNIMNNSGNGIHYGIYNEMLGSGTGIKYAMYNSINSPGAANQFGNYIDFTGSGSGDLFGSRVVMANTSNGQHIGNATDISGAGTGSHFGTYNTLSGAGAGNQYGSYNRLSNTGAGIHYGIYNDMQASGIGIKYGIYNRLSNTGTAKQYGSYVDLTGSGGGEIHGSSVAISNNGDGIHFGSYTDIIGTGNGAKYGSANYDNNSGTGIHYGTFNSLSGIGTGNQFGVNNQITNSANGEHYGAYSFLSGTGSGLKYGQFIRVVPTAGGFHYGIYSEVLKPGSSNYAGYFLGNVSVGTTASNNYILPASRGTVGQIIQTDGLGNSSWVSPSALSVTETDPQVSSATNNVIPKWNGTTLVDGVLNDNGTNVGVGIAPSAGNKLEVNGKTKTSDFQMTTGATTNFVLQSDATGNASWVSPSSLSVTETDPQVSSATSNIIPKWNGTTLVDGVLNDNGTNVGVGIAPSAGNKLEVNGKTKTSDFQMTTGAAANFVLQSDALGNATWQNLNSSTWLTTGNSGTSAATNFIGTTDDVDFVMKRNNVRAGFIGNPNTTTGNRNTSFGANTLNPATTGNRNTAIGTNALPINTTGSLNTAIGESSLFTNSVGNENTAIGVGALYFNDGSFNTGLGRNALTSNSTGSSNTATGYFALRSNSTGNFNTATGRDAMRANTIGIENTASGVNSLFVNTIGNGNTSTGVQSLRNNLSGNNNAGYGFQSLFTNSTGSTNVALGYKSGYFETGSNKLYIENSDANADNALIYGEFDTNILRTNSQFQIGNPAVAGYALPTSRGTVGQVLQSDGAGNTTWVAASTLSVTETDPQVSSNTNNIVPKWNGSTLVDGVLNDNGTSVGVGIAPSAGNKLEVNGKTKTTDLQITNGAVANYVLQSDALGNASWVNPNMKSIIRTNLSATQSLNNSGWQLLTFDTIVIDTNTEFSTGTNRFTATKAGYYQINAGYHTNDQNNTLLYSVGVYKNGALYQQTTNNHSNIGAVTRNINCIVNLAVGEYVEIFAENYQAGVNVDSSSGKTFFEVLQIR